MHRFYVEHPASAGKTAVLSPEESAHAARVLRLRPGEEIVLLDGQTLWSAKLEVVNDRACEARVLSALPSPEPCAKVTLIQGLPKSDKLEWIVQKAVELGAYRIVPFAAKRSVVKLDQKKAGKKRERWQAIAKGAAEQSKRGIVPQVQDVMSFQEAMNYAKELDVVLVPYELQEGMKATEAVISKIEPGQSVGIFIGPEGGFDESEIEQAKEAGAIPITLGKRILRTETAGLTTLSILMYHLECREQLDDKNIR